MARRPRTARASAEQPRIAHPHAAHPLIERPGILDTVGLVAFVGGLVLWYAGGHQAMNALLDGAALRNLVLLLAALSAVIVALLQRGLPPKKLLGNAGFMAAGVAMSGSCVLAIANRALDTSSVHDEPAQIVSYKKPSKGPEDVTIAIDGRRASFYAERAPRPPCAAGAPATVHLRDGALGMRWLASVTCAPAPPSAAPSPAPIAPGAAPR